MKNVNGIAVAGVILVDKINEINAYPNCGELTQIKNVSVSTGGCVPNVAIDLKKIMPNLTVKAIGKVGLDQEGDYVKSVLSSNGIDVSMVKTCSDKTSFTEVMSIVGGQRTFFTYAGANADFCAKDIDFSGLNVKMLHLGYFLLMDKVDNGDGEKILRLAKENGIETSIDLVSENSNRYQAVIPCLKYTDNLIINEVEAGNLVGEIANEDNLPSIAEKLLKMGVNKRVIIHTPSMSVCVSSRGVTILPSYKIAPELIKGTTGAGDAFCAGALSGIYLEKSDKEILELASSVAVMALFSQDAVSGMKTLAEIELYCKKFSRRK
ncbi:MAG: carbohydrate kinase family protein [Clostridia bacterium]|nr:carbohydrate kinase family protein [Clostridia bacterium]